MSDTSVSPRLSLEQLRKQAKELLKAHQAGDPDAARRFQIARRRADNVVLADSQFVLAREHGFESWAALVAHLEASPMGLEPYEQFAQTLLDAYTTGDFTAIRELNWRHGTGFAWDRDPERMKQWVPSGTIGDARTLVARQSGFESWEELVRSLHPQVRRRAGRAIAPFFRVDRANNRIEVRGMLSSIHWDAVLGAMRDNGITGLAAGGMDDTTLERLAGHEALTQLWLGGSGLLTDAGLKHLARLPHLEELDLSSPRSAVTDRGLEVLRRLPALRRFQMCWAPQITDSGVAHLAACDRLESVDLMGTHTGDGAIRALEGKVDLRRLKTGRLVSDAGLPHLHGIPAFRTWQGGVADLELTSYDPGPNHLLLDGPFTDRGLAALAGLDGLFGLSFFWHVSAMTSAALAALADLPSLGFLGCEGSLCDDRAMVHIAAIPRLRMLMAQGTVAGDDGFIALSRSRSLEFLWGRECPNLKGRGFAALADLPALRGLGVSLKAVDDVSLAALSRFPSLTQLMPMDISDHGFRHVGACAGLESLWCMYCRETTDVATGHLAGLTRLKRYYAGMTGITDASLEVLSQLLALESLEFWQIAGITDDGVAKLASLPRLRELSIDGSPKVTRASAGRFPPGVTVRITG